MLDYLLPTFEQNNSKPNSCEPNSSLESCGETEDISLLTISAGLKQFVADSVINHENIDKMSELFVDNVKVTPEEIATINTATIGQHTNDNWHMMRH